MNPNPPEIDALEERLRTTLSVSGAAAAWEWHADARRVVGDAGFATLYGITPAQAAEGISPARFFALIHPQDVDRMRLAIGGMLRGSEVLTKQYRVVLADRTVRWLQARGRSHVEGGGGADAARFSGVLVDITEQKRLEERLRVAQTAGGVGTFEHVAGFGTATVSAQFCTLLGLHVAADLPVRTINAVVWPGDPAVIDLAAPAPGGISEVEFRIVRPDTGEHRWLTRRGESRIWSGPRARPCWACRSTSPRPTCRSTRSTKFGRRAPIRWSRPWKRRWQSICAGGTPS